MMIIIMATASIPARPMCSPVPVGKTWTEQAKLTASNGAAGDEFGWSVSLSGDTALVGAIRSGSAYLFTRSGTTWTEQAKLTASDGEEGDKFGISISLSGDTALVGARDDSDGNVYYDGSAYFYTLSFNSEANKLFNWLEEIFPEVLSPTHTQYAAGWCFRHYPYPGIYTGVVCKDGGQFPFGYVYALVGIDVYEFGHISQYSDQFNNQSNDSSDNPSLIGTWHLSTVNGQPVIPGVFLIWTITESTVTATSDLDCIEVGTYSISGDMVSVTTISLSGTQCGGHVGEQNSAGPFTVSETTLTIIINDEELGTATFVFTKQR